MPHSTLTSQKSDILEIQAVHSRLRYIFLKHQILKDHDEIYFPMKKLISDFRLRFFPLTLQKDIPAITAKHYGYT